MADDILKNSLTGTTPLTPTPVLPTPPTALQVPTLSGNNQVDIRTLGTAQQQPNAILNLQKAMQNASRVAYNERQSQELGTLGFDPSKVSGNTFASIIGTLEQRRGADVSKIYSSTMETYKTVQAETTRRLEALQQLEEDKRRWEEEQKQRKKEYEYMKKKDKEAAKQMKKQNEEDKRRWELTFAESKKKVGSSNSYSSGFDSAVKTDFSNITMGEDGHINPIEYNQWLKKALSAADTAKDYSLLNTLATKGKDLLNPADYKWKPDDSSSIDEQIKSILGE